MAIVAVTRAGYAYMAGALLRDALPTGRAIPPMATLGYAMVAVVGLASVKGIAYYGQRILMARIGHDVVLDLRRRVYRKLLELPPATLLMQRRGELASAAVGELHRLVELVDPGLSLLLRHVLTVLVVGAVAFHLNPYLAPVALAGCPALAWYMVRSGQRSRKADADSGEAKGDLAGRLAELAGMVLLVRSYRAEDRALRVFDDLAITAQKKAVVATSATSRSGPALEVIGAFAVAATLLVAGYQAEAGTVSPDANVAFFACIFFLYKPIDQLNQAAQHVTEGLTTFDRVMALLGLESEAADPPGNVDVPPLEKDLRLAGVHFAYRDRPILQGVDLTLRKGEAVAIVGSSGAGKSTLLLLLMGLLHPSEGEMFVDGVATSRATRRSLRGQFAWVTQEPMLLADTILANIAFGAVEPDRERARWAATAAGAHGFVSELPQGYDTPLVEGGTQLSGGQRQRLCIARALYGNAPVLLFDEATAALDTATEAEINRTIAELSGLRTVVVVSHRLSALRNVSRVVVLESGRIVEEGSVDSLLTAQGSFARLFGTAGAS